jgi:CxxC-x17-CxxC domain-containing protein
MYDNTKPRFPRKSFGNKPFGKKPFGNRGGYDQGPREMFKADCAKCGNVCEVPFRPNGTKPVYCNNCFEKPAQSGERSFQPRREFAPQAPQAPRNDQAFNDLKAELRVVNQNLERLIALMTPAPKAPKVSKKKAGAK